VINYEFVDLVLKIIYHFLLVSTYPLFNMLSNYCLTIRDNVFAVCWLIYGG
jgi:hypothetical protein